jgi:hypothetical protein
MIAFDKSSGPTLHVFEQDGFWQWGITCARPGGVGAKVIAYSDPGFCSEQEARADGERVRSRLGDHNIRECA